MQTRAANPLGRARARWDHFWFAPAPPDNLGLCRILFYAFVLLYYLDRDFSLFGEVTPALWNPLWLYRRVFVFPTPAPGVLAVVQVVWQVSLAMACLGLLTRAATPVAFVLGLYLVGQTYNYGYTSHMDAAAMIVLGIMAVARPGDAWSVGRLLARPRGAAPPPASGEYTWPVRLVWVLLSLVFFAAGVAKLRHGGLEWVTSDSMAHMLQRPHYPLARGSLPPLTTWGLWVSRQPLLYKSLAAGTILVELGYPLALLGTRLRILFVGAMLLMLFGFRLLLGPSFEMLAACHLFWVPWDRVVSWVRRRWRPDHVRSASDSSVQAAEASPTTR